MAENHIHRRALVETDPAGPCGTRVGPNAQIGALAHVCYGAVVGRNAVVGCGAHVGLGVVIGMDAIVWDGVFLPRNVVVEEDAVLGVQVAVIEAEPRTQATLIRDWPRTLIREGARIGARSTLMAGVTVGRFARIAPGSWVTADLPDFARAGGNPAQVEGWVCQCGEPLTVGHDADGSVRCACGRAYTLVDGLPREVEAAS